MQRLRAKENEKTGHFSDYPDPEPERKNSFSWLEKKGTSGTLRGEETRGRSEKKSNRE